MNLFRSLLLAAAALSLLAAPAYPNWVSLGPDGGTVGLLAVDPSRPSVLYAGTSATGVFKSIDAGATWTWAGAGLQAELKTRGIFALAVDPRHPSTVLAGVHDGLFQSRDGGATWSPASPGLHEWVYALLFDPQHDRVVYAGTSSGVFRSTDGGAHWQRRGSGVYRSVNGGLIWRRAKGIPGPALSFAVQPSRRQVYVAVAGRGVFVSKDGGARWQASPGQPADPAVFSLAASPAAVYAGTEGFAHPPGGVFRSADGGASWSLRNRGLSTVRIPSLALFARDADHLDVFAAAGVQGLLRSQDGGATWQRLGLVAFLQGIVDVAVEPRAGLPPRVHAVSAIHPPSFFRSDDGGATWQTPGSPPPGVQLIRLVRDPRSPGALWVSGRNGLFHTADAGATWTRAPLEQATALLYLIDVVPDVRNPQTIWASGYEFAGTLYPTPYTRVFRSTDGGETWDRHEAGLPEKVGADVVQNPYDPETLYAATGAGLYRSTDDGASWSLVPALGEKRIGAVGFTPSAVWADVWGVGPYRSEDGVTGWELDDAGLTSRNILRLVPDPRDPERLFAATQNGGVFVHADP